MYGLEYLLPLVFVTPLIATIIVVYGMRHLFYHRFISPIDGAFLSEPGQSLRDRLDNALIRLYLLASAGPLLALAPIVYGMGRMLITTEQNWLEWALYGVGSTVVVFALAGMMVATWQRVRRLKLGLSCELAVIDTLRALDGRDAGGYAVYTNIDCPLEPITAIVLTPQGLYTVTAKARLRPIHVGIHEPVIVQREQLQFPHLREHQPVREARSACRWLSHQLEAHIKTPVFVTGVVTLPAWQVQGQASGNDVLVLGGHQLVQGLLTHTPPTVLTPEQHDTLARLLTRWAAGDMYFPKM